MLYLSETFKTVKDNVVFLLASTSGAAMTAHSTVTIATASVAPSHPVDIQVYAAFAQAILGAVITIGGLTFTVINAIHASNHSKMDEFNTAVNGLRATLETEKAEHERTEQLLGNAQEEILRLKTLLAEEKRKPREPRRKTIPSE